jgi:hypothetical protein
MTGGRALPPILSKEDFTHTLEKAIPVQARRQQRHSQRPSKVLSQETLTPQRWQQRLPQTTWIDVDEEKKCGEMGSTETKTSDDPT